MKLPKALALYLPAQPPPLIWRYKCSTCSFFQDPNTCSIVSERGPPDDGTINPESWCVLWTPRDDDAPFAWLSIPSNFAVNGKTFAFTYVATNPTDLRVGLGGKPISDGTAMLFVFPTSDYYNFWMYGVGSPLDIIWLDVDGKVVDLVKNAPVCPSGQCQTYRPASPASYGIETKAGFADANGITVGTVVSLLPA